MKFLSTVGLFVLGCAMSADAFSLYYDGKTIVHDARRQIFPCQKQTFKEGNNLSFFNSNVDLADNCHLTLYDDSECKKIAGSSYGEWRKKLSQNVYSWSYTC
ncbi:hypothetical protein ASPWEDRAFT_71281 [Aspergillus wentii DTO 134E9]|uniref:Uncharacterized protein n=1 Tax=Aspergillus wentii DTO 134E9 TaxID=1073089 RepID=A0A1L9RAG5_ASPWE|nr:uncharacterized protein ASPWEDRAFT_71281 [Aspergillus wentii DTO 134E9]KAI9934491.1 hypothetical protein MW887_000105 [Aspergillus wentii]OJJ31900.1 hypothetical protein ASPWEDRAFT_71281 [Aspergillus wentii DTO 134E9]